MLRCCQGLALLLFAGSLGGCPPDERSFGGAVLGVGDSGAQTDDQRLIAVGRALAGTWRGKAEVEMLLGPESTELSLEWRSDADPRSGILEMRCAPGQNCAFRPFRYHLYDIEPDGTVRGVVEAAQAPQGVGGLELRFGGAGLELTVGIGPLAFISDGHFTKDATAASPADAAAPGP